MRDDAVRRSPGPRRVHAAPVFILVTLAASEPPGEQQPGRRCPGRLTACCLARPVQGTAPRCRRSPAGRRRWRPGRRDVTAGAAGRAPGTVPRPSLSDPIADLELFRGQTEAERWRICRLLASAVTAAMPKYPAAQRLAPPHCRPCVTRANALESAARKGSRARTRHYPSAQRPNKAPSLTRSARYPAVARMSGMVPVLTLAAPRCEVRRRTAPCPAPRA
jgi:hypothetical protein